MSATLIAVIPLALLGIAALLGFAGCALHTGGLPGGPETHTDPYDDMMKLETTLVAFWTLTDAMGAATATAQNNGFNGTYKGGFGMTNYDPVSKSAGAAGDVTAGQAGIVPGDALDGVQDTSAFFNGGIVFVDWQKAINTLTTFTVEAWVSPDPTWTKSPEALRGLIVSNQTSPSFKGFGLFANTDSATQTNNFWQFSLGTGMQPVGPKFPIDFATSVYHLVGTLDDTGVATLYVNGDAVDSFDLTAMGSTYQPLDDGTTRLFIGAGAPQNGIMSPPLFPVVGNLQCVAIYSSALGAGTVKTHFSTGMKMGA
jgi:Concanavalin A-like lectin/glucanases superfamily